MSIYSVCYSVRLVNMQSKKISQVGATETCRLEHAASAVLTPNGGLRFDSPGRVLDKHINKSSPELLDALTPKCSVVSTPPKN